jgi:hypothetical protein
MRTERPMRMTFRSPRTIRRRTVFEDTLRPAAASLTRKRVVLLETNSAGEHDGLDATTGGLDVSRCPCAQAGTTELKRGGFGSRFMPRANGLRQKKTIQ